MEKMTGAKKLAFIGAMGSGKSTLARRYGEEVGGDVLDVDDEFERRYGKIKAFFERHGESEFRKREQELVEFAAKSGACAVATGGGAVLGKHGISALRKHYDIVYLTAPAEVLEKRIADSSRPLKAVHKALAQERESLYMKYADYVVDTSTDAFGRLMAAVSVPRKNRYDTVLCDADDTVLDFQKAMRSSLTAAARECGIKAQEEVLISEYKKILPVVWGRLERGEITHDELNVLRFAMLKNAIADDFDADAMRETYTAKMMATRYLIDGATAFLTELRSRGIKVYIITNSPAAIAKQRLKALDGYIDGAFISESIGYDKPNVKFFDAVFSELGKADIERTIVFGDGVTSDIAGATAYGLDSCLFDRSGNANSSADYSVNNYAEFLEFV